MTDDTELRRKIDRIRSEGWTVGEIAREAGADVSNMRLEDAPPIVALFDQYGRDAVLAAVRDSNKKLADDLLRRIDEFIEKDRQQRRSDR